MENLTINTGTLKVEPTPSRIFITNAFNDDRYLSIPKSEAKKLIKALQKAIDFKN